MSRRAPLAFAALLFAAPAIAAPPPDHPARSRTHARRVAPRPAGEDLARRLDVNRLSLYVTNVGAWAHDVVSGGPGMTFPRGSGLVSMFASGLWIGARVGGETRVTVAEYSQEFTPGRAGDVASPAHRVYKVARWSGDPADTARVERGAAELAAQPDLDPLVHHSWSEYVAGAAPLGAPVRIHRLPDPSTPAPDDSVDVPGPDVAGDVMLWCVYHDADPARHDNPAGETAPLGVEVRQKLWGFRGAGPLGHAAFVELTIHNRGTALLEDLRVGAWADPDVGVYTDDLAGCDPGRALGYVYNQPPADDLYGVEAPAVGLDLLRAPGDPLGTAPLHAFRVLVNGADPRSATESYHALAGLTLDGDALVDPTTLAETRHERAGDPVTGTGWVDAEAADRRIVLGAAPVTLAPGDSVTLVLAIVVGQGPSPLASISQLRCHDDAVQAAWTSGFALPETETACTAVRNCPRSADFWERQCGAGRDLPAGALALVAREVDALSPVFDFGADARAGLCAALAAPAETDARARARREYAALLASVAASRYGVLETDGSAILIDEGTPLACAGVPGADLAAAITPAPPPRLLDAGFVLGDPLRAPPLEGVGSALERFGGGAGHASTFPGSALHPDVHADSFATVEIRFGGGASQPAYRYLRLEQADGGDAPPQGRAFLYGGWVTVPFEVWDTDRGVRLECAFVERVLTDDAGVMLPEPQQLPTLDSTWAPDTTALGGREYLVVLRGADAGAPDPSLARDGVPLEASWPALYALWTRRAAAAPPIGDGDRFVIRWGMPPVASVDALLADLDARAPADPGVVAAYDAVAACLEPVNRGVGIGPVCDRVTPALASFTSLTVSGGFVRATFWVPGAGEAIAVERSRGGEPWERRTTFAPGAGAVEHVEASPEPGTRVGFRLRGLASDRVLDEAWIEIPGAGDLTLAGFHPHPAGPAAALAFHLPGRGRARVELLDVAGRRVARRDLGTLEAGGHAVRIEELRRVPPGIYVVRLEWAGRRVTRRAVLTR